MKFSFFYFSLFFLFGAHCLIPSNNNRKKFKFNYHNPSNDLKVIDSKRAYLISKNWLDNIALYVVNKYKNEINIKNNKLFEYDEVFLVTKINEFRKVIDEKNNDFLYLSWMPKGLYGIEEVLYMIIAENKNKTFCIKYALESPYWNSNQIKSNKLKLSLIDQSEINNCTINFDELYENDIRHKLSWSTWNLD